MHATKLAKLATPPGDASLHLQDLIALEVFFASRGKSLKDVTVFERHDILESLAEKQHITFLLGSKPRPNARRNDLSRWDTRSLAALLSRASKFDVRMGYEIEDVLLDEPMDENKARHEAWYRILDDDTRSLVAIGSPRACHASEIMLARMFGVPPFKTAFQRGDAVSVAHLRTPFAFLWKGEKPKGGFHSSFALTEREFKALEKGYPCKNGQGEKWYLKKKTAALMFDGGAYVMPHGVLEYNAYGVIAAQRRKAGNVWLVLAGITGPATYAAVGLLKEIHADLPHQGGRDGDVLWQPFSVTITVDQTSHIGDDREMSEPKRMGEPQWFDPYKKEAKRTDPS